MLSNAELDMGYYHPRHGHLTQSLCPGAIFAKPTPHNPTDPNYRVVCLSGGGPWLVTMPWFKWRKFLFHAARADQPTCVISPEARYGGRTTHAGARNPHIRFSSFRNICIAAGITPMDLDFGRAGPGCGPVPLRPAPRNKSCILGNSELELGSLDDMLEKPVLKALDSIIANAKAGLECSEVVTILDFKCVLPSFP